MEDSAARSQHMIEELRANPERAFHTAVENLQRAREAYITPPGLIMVVSIGE